jgi:hypothetical protein
MNLSERDKHLLLIIPALLSFLCYGFFFFGGRQATLDKLQKDVSKAREQIPKSTEKQNVQLQLARLNEQLDTDRDQVEALRTRWCGLADKCTSGADRNERVQRLGQLLARRGVRILEDVAADVTKEPRATPIMSTLKSEAMELSGKQNLAFRKVRFLADYKSVYSLMDELARGEVVAVPVGLTMKQPKKGAWPEWQLLVWV